MKQAKILLLIAIILFTGICYAQGYYADITLEVKENGAVNISGTTNSTYLLLGETQTLTTKQGEVWTLNFEAQEEFETYSLEVIFPSGVEIIKAKASGASAITTKEGKTALITSGNGQIAVQIEYKLNSSAKETPNFTLFGIVLIILIMTGIALFAFKKMKPKKEKKKYDKEVLTDRQKQIAEVIEKNNGKATQAEIQKELGLPKASLSRNLRTMEKKGMIRKDKKGNTMLIRFTEKN
jgi:uncharacterized membrane protein